ncbi:MAG: peptidase M23 [Thiobacillus sp. 63-78]|uniref:murein hydrolase activator EnvC family protein n=1 Tax=Thiobacillus sp. 63-78 TaxID=1895859 RepID=UPI000869B57C|nr:peptidoglycan DD-metalloendopeptidase family protein [Thiobacillus sp. 63-78]MBN8762574.1 peptidoglycan DD-metalloendopeptidase family protein [Thiobacillus sp.]ODV14092.1 MAG: peptidase M23 [Thiobacillus sp. SCN 64-317]MBN8766046.1 peptidoglycan DD-metalloendopeptidase family protein [Thiobacillus sp.]MBN8774015.1 peptidoglycan DD-metalloendopeptidase family protein [Thiobacillus sp.]OJZ15818.1 MAG: peptidase M23 [Thiobacillus sp. 63-78]
MNFKYFFVLLALSWPLCAAANQADRKQSELDALKQRLQTLQQDFRDNQAHRQEAADALRQSERAISSAVRQLRQLDGERQRSQSELQSLTQQAEATSARIHTQQAHLAQTLKGAYQRGQGDALKLILNGADPNQTARDLRYLAHLSRAQQAMIETLRADLAQLSALRQQTSQKTTELAQLQAAHEAEQQKLLADKHAREQVLQKLSGQIRQQQREIATLKRNERSLTQLVERLNRLMAQQAAREAERARAAQKSRQREAERGTSERPRRPVAVNTDTPVAFRSSQPFSRLKGLLHLPVAGELMNRFGAPREGGGLSWRGLFIRAAQGTAVKAIAAGQVVFAEWLRGFGNLIIVDHGEGYMSLYSNNESLYKQVGDRVQPGDAIAAVGNSGGQPDTGLYFEMRHQSRPVNPLDWVK